MHSGLTRTVYTSPYIPQDISHLNLVCDLRGCRRVKTHLSGTQKPRGLHASTKAPREPAPPDGDRTVPSQLRAQQYLEASGNITACSAQVLHSQGCQEQEHCCHPRLHPDTSWQIQQPSSRDMPQAGQEANVPQGQGSGSAPARFPVRRQLTIVLFRADQR